jgi:hypothetical protein
VTCEPAERAQRAARNGGARLVNKRAVAQRPRELKEALKVVDGGARVTLLIVDDAKVVARLCLRTDLTGPLREVDEGLKVRHSASSVANLLVRARERKRGCALPVIVAALLAELEVGLVVLDRARWLLEEL